MRNLSLNQQEVTPTITNEIQLFKLETHILRVHVNCDGCRRKVKKILKKIEGVYSVEIDAEEEKVTVRGEVESSKLIGKLAKSGKHAELWFPTPTNENEGSEDDAGDTSSWVQRYETNEEEEWKGEENVEYMRTPEQGLYDGGVGLMSTRVPPWYMYQLYPPSSSMNMMPFFRGYSSYLPNGVNMMVDEHRQIHQAGAGQNVYPLRPSRYWNY